MDFESTGLFFSWYQSFWANRDWWINVMNLPQRREFYYHVRIPLLWYWPALKSLKLDKLHVPWTNSRLEFSISSTWPESWYQGQSTWHQVDPNDIYLGSSWSHFSGQALVRSQNGKGQGGRCTPTLQPWLTWLYPHPAPHPWPQNENITSSPKIDPIHMYVESYMVVKYYTIFLTILHQWWCQNRKLGATWHCTATGALFLHFYEWCLWH
jgi:hypothetical protein